MTTRIRMHWGWVLACGLLAACGGDDDGGSDADGGPGGPDGGAVCEAGTQDEDGDGVCNADCSETACENGTCAVDGDSGLAICSCDAGFTGDACDALLAPDPADTVFWIDAADMDTFTFEPMSTTITSWTDKSPAGLVGTTVDINSSPALVDDAPTGLPVVMFDGTDDRVLFEGFSGITDVTNYTVFVVLEVDEGTVGTVYEGEGPDIDRFSAGVSNAFFIHYHEPGLGDFDGEVSSEDYGDGGWSTGQYHLVTFRVNNQEIAGWVDGNYADATAVEDMMPIDEVLALAIGANPSGGNELEGSIAEMIIVADDLHYGERKPYEDYLAAKWFGAAFERTPSAFGATPVWLDASAAATVNTVDSSVTDWSNRGMFGGFFGNGSFPDARPTLIEDGLNGLPVIRFDGGDALAQNDLEFPEMGHEGDYTIIAVITPPTTGSAQTLFNSIDQSNDNLVLAAEIDPDGQSLDYLHRYPADDAGGDLFSIDADLSGPRIIKIERALTASYHFVVGDQTSSQSGAESGLPHEILRWVLGGDDIAGPVNAFDGDVAEFIVLANSLGNAEETALLDLLAAKWGL